MSNVIPEGWSKLKLGDLSDLVTKGTTPKSYCSTGINFVKVESVSASSTLIPSKFAYIDLETHASLKRSQLKAGDILFSIAGSLGRLSLIQKKHLPANTNQALAIIRLSKDSINPLFCTQQLKGEVIQTELKKLQTVGAQPNLSLQQVSDILLVRPPLPEQQKIAAILSSVDEVIEKTQAQINKLKDLKTGMMQELLSPREGQAATINNPQGESKNSLHHTEFKDSPLGRIPVGWEVVSLGQTGKWSGGGTPSKANKEFWGGNIPWVSPKDMKVEFINRTQDYITEEAISNSSTNMVKEGSLLMVVRSGILQHTLPLAIAARDLTLNQDMKALSVTEGYSAVFIYNYLQANNHKVLRATLKAGNTVESLDFNEFSNYLIPCPPPKEQEYIVKVVGAVAKNLRDKSSQLINYKNLKKALMQDLLTGKVRVKVD